MRTTIDLPEDLHELAKRIARDTSRTLSETVVDLVRRGLADPGATSVLAAVAERPRHEFWEDDLPYRKVHLRGVVGHRQVTDAYLAALSRRRGGRLATFDRGLAALHRDVAILVPA